jgi:hypothetical protein
MTTTATKTPSKIYAMTTIVYLESGEIDIQSTEIAQQRDWHDVIRRADEAAKPSWSYRTIAKVKIESVRTQPDGTVRRYPVSRCVECDCWWTPGEPHVHTPQRRPQQGDVIHYDCTVKRAPEGTPFVETHDWSWNDERWNVIERGYDVTVKEVKIEEAWSYGDTDYPETTEVYYEITLTGDWEGAEPDDVPSAGMLCSTDLDDWRRWHSRN